MLDFFAPAGRYLVPYLSEISTAMIACLLVVGGGEINRLMRNGLRNYHFIIRTFAFILINAFGYGLIIVKATPYLTQVLRRFDNGSMFCIVIGCFVFVGLWAQRNRQI
jgi:hypothetical protein